MQDAWSTCCLTLQHASKPTTHEKLLPLQGLAEWMQAKLDAGLPTNIAKRVSPLMKTSTAPQELAEWMQAKLDTHPLFERISDEELEADPAAWLLAEGTEEGQKVARNSGQVWRAVYRRVAGALQ